MFRVAVWRHQSFWQEGWTNNDTLIGLHETWVQLGANHVCVAVSHRRILVFRTFSDTEFFRILKFHIFSKQYFIFGHVRAKNILSDPLKSPFPKISLKKINSYSVEVKISRICKLDVRLTIIMCFIIWHLINLACQIARDKSQQNIHFLIIRWWGQQFVGSVE